MTRSVAVHTDVAGAARDAAGRLAESIAAACAERGVAHVALAGGDTPRIAYPLLAPLVGEPELVDWWFGDERAVPPTHDASNYAMVAETLLPSAGLERSRVHRIRAELGSQRAAALYERELQAWLGRGDDGVPVLDAVLLGLGTDCHTASLWPGSPALSTRDRWCMAVRAPGPPVDRVTLTLPVLRAARRVVVLACGDAKAGAVATAVAAPDPACPGSLVDRAEFVIDRAAAALTRPSGDET